MLLVYMPHFEIIPSSQKCAFSGSIGSEDFMIRDYHRCLSIILDPMVKFMKNYSYIKVRRGKTTRILQIYIEWSIWGVGVDNKTANMLCTRSMNKGKTSINMTRCCLTNSQNSQKSQHQCHQIDGSLMQNLSILALGPVYGIYTGVKFS